MQVQQAIFRHRALTQELFNIGDEVATYIENLCEAIADWDAELVEDCLAEFQEIITDAREDARVTTTSLVGLRHALVSGMAKGSLGIEPAPVAPTQIPEPISGVELRAAFPLASSPVAVAELSERMQARTRFVQQYLETVVEWELLETQRGARALDLVDLPRLYRKVGEIVESVATAWLDAVAFEQPAFTRTMRGSNPPEFLNERARIEMIASRVFGRRSQVDFVG
ncbi:MAG: hypothetical protein Q3976_04025 [Corynebacterium sp.]|nr:hypothetical protein [Corynebacterium sp.]